MTGAGAAVSGCGEPAVVKYGSLRVDKAGIQAPLNATNAPVAILVHGGGWKSGSRIYMCTHASALRARGFVTVNLDYPRATKTRPGWSVELNAIKAAVNWTKAHIQSYGGDPNQVVMLGSSAGGNLAFLAALQLNAQTPGYVRAVAGLSVPTDLTALATDGANIGLQNVAALYLGCPGIYYAQYAQCSPSVEQAASPLFNISPNCPPFYIANGASETMVPIAQARRMATALQAAGCQVTTHYYPGTTHADWPSEANLIPAWLWSNR